jgi:hypothetical protein
LIAQRCDVASQAKYFQVSWRAGAISIEIDARARYPSRRERTLNNVMTGCLKPFRGYEGLTRRR